MLIGHNPALQVLVLALARSGDALEDIGRKYPTGALATLEFRLPWSELDLATAELVAYARPKDLQ